MVVEVQRSPGVTGEVSAASTLGADRDEVETTVSPTDLGMQHRLSSSWSNSYKLEYQAMAEGGVDTSTFSSLTHTGSLIRKAHGLGDSMSMGNGAGMGSLEQKIQELRAEKEAGELKKSASIHSDQDSPLDFSVKRRRPSFSGSLTDDSQASSSSPGHMTDYTTVSPPAESGSVSQNASVSKRGTPSPDRLEAQKALDHLNGIGVFTDNVLGSESPLTAFSQMTVAATLMDPRNKKNSRPFKAYPKEALQMPLGFFGISGLTPAVLQQGMDSGVFAGMSSEDIVNLYNQQLQLFRDKQLSRQSGKTSPHSQVSAPNGSYGNHHHHHHRHQQQQQPTEEAHHSPHNHRHPSPSAMSQQHPSASRSPSSHEHSKISGNSSTSFPAPATAASMNATLVSSTSSYSNQSSSSSSGGGSRKRPRSLPDDQKDAAYWERRRKNNDAAKRSRDARRAKEDEIAIRAALLEQENLKLRVEVAALKTETARLRQRREEKAAVNTADPDPMEVNHGHQNISGHRDVVS